MIRLSTIKKLLWIWRKVLMLSVTLLHTKIPYCSCAQCHTATHKNSLLFLCSVSHCYTQKFHTVLVLGVTLLHTKIPHCSCAQCHTATHKNSALFLCSVSQCYTQKFRTVLVLSVTLLHTKILDSSCAQCHTATHKMTPKALQKVRKRPLRSKHILTAFCTFCFSANVHWRHHFHSGFFFQISWSVSYLNFSELFPFSPFYFLD